MQDDNAPAYLGDGVYAVMENGMIRLTADDPHGEKRIYLEPAVYMALVEYAGRLPHFT